MALTTEQQTKLLLACSECKRQYDATGYAPRSRFHCACGETIEIPEVKCHDSAVVRCSSCGAPRSVGSSSCEHCGANYTLHEQDLDTICSACMTRVSNKARFCHHCATPIVPQGTVGKPTDHRCPACRVRHKLTSRTLGDLSIALLECPHCAGIWLGQDAFQLVADRSRESKLPQDLAGKPGTMPTATANEAAGGMRYRRCLVCRKHMNRLNYGKRSGVVIDTCKDHGVWFDAHELGAILHWIRKGGEDHSVRKDAEEQRARERSQAIKLPSLERAETYGGQGRTNWDADSGGGLIGNLLGHLFNL
jgi:Zn-finger nucleic acid-binding protein